VEGMESTTPGESPSVASVGVELAAMWRELFKKRELPLSDGSDFFGLGGSSLLAVQLVERIYERYGVELGMLALIECPTLGQQAALVSTLLLEAEEGTL
jgi:phthiocerol/phenolphthiocerol synthesis type-I polyketide synthase E